jgi:hypothetical protein
MLAQMPLSADSGGDKMSPFTNYLSPATPGGAQEWTNSYVQFDSSALPAGTSNDNGPPTLDCTCTVNLAPNKYGECVVKKAGKECECMDPMKVDGTGNGTQVRIQCGGWTIACGVGTNCPLEYNHSYKRKSKGGVCEVTAGPQGGSGTCWGTDP